MTRKMEWLVGKWTSDDTGVALEISFCRKRLRVRAVDTSDGEALRISKTRWDGECLIFERLVPSNGWQTRSRLIPVSRTRLIEEVTFCTKWTKAATGRLRTHVLAASGDRSCNQAGRAKLEWLLGDWQCSDESVLVRYEIVETSRGLRIRAYGTDNGAELRVSRPRWDGKALAFEVSGASDHWRTRCSLRPVSATRAVEEDTLREDWQKVS